ncbi:MAG: cation transporter [Candidatus Aenigmarchaeota archaeon]|nr:cation transporter [Candidatus Aenigmarchaeota archaeon]
MSETKTVTFAVGGLHCGSCEAVVKRAVGKLAGVQDISFSGEHVTVHFAPEQLTAEQIARTIAQKGYRATAPGLDIRPAGPGVRGGLRALWKEQAFQAERQMIQHGAIAFIILAFLQSFILRGLFPAAAGGIWPLSLYLILTVAAVGAALWHFFSFRKQVSCMTGMMVGMTMGMVAGFLAGAIVAAANGILIGSVYGVLAGMLVGAWAGRCCGVMGLMEGMMAGLMSGVMGGMIPLMFLSENVFLFYPVLAGACILILGGLTYHLSWENREYEKAHGSPVERKPLSFLAYLAVCFIIIFLTTALMVWGPQSPLGVPGAG